MKLELKHLDKYMKKAIDEITNVRNLTRYSKVIAEELRKQIRVSAKRATRHGGTLTKFPALKPSTIKIRQKTKLTNETRARMSHVTMTGLMLDSLTGASPKNKEIELYISNREREKIAKILTDGTARIKARPFMFISNLTMNKITESIERMLFDKISKLIAK